MSNKSMTTNRSLPHVGRALPLNRNLKKFWWKKYLSIVDNNGQRYASELFTKMRVGFLGFIDQEDHSPEARRAFAKSLPFRDSGWLRMLIDYACTDPISVLQFLKLYTTAKEPAISVEESAEVQHQLLSETVVTRKIRLSVYLYYITLHPAVWKRQVTLHKKDPHYFDYDRIFEVKIGKKYFKIHWPGTVQSDLAENYPIWKSHRKILLSTFYPIISQHGIDAWIDYVRKWRKMTKCTNHFQSWSRSRHLILKGIPHPASYSETDYGKNISGEEACLRFEEDTWGFAASIRACCQATGMSSEFFTDGLSEEFDEYTDMVNDPDGDVVIGHIHHIPKKGTYKRRPIADPNRYLQAHLMPLKAYLDDIAGDWERNCMRNQAKCDAIITNANQNGYAGSVDLSQATDNLPFYLFEEIAEQLNWFESIPEKVNDTSCVIYARRDKVDLSQLPLDTRMKVASLHSSLAQERYCHNICVNQSWMLFKWMLSQSWENEQYLDKWQKGQPLGTLPSFNILSITQYILAEISSLKARRIDSPFAILGDDIVFLDKQARTNYLKILGRLEVPVSLQKSFDGRLVEFAGKVWVRNQKVAYTPTMSPVYLSNLFDYQRAAQINLSWEDLPKKVRDGFTNLCKSSGIESPGNAYKACQAFLGIPCFQLSQESEDMVLALCLSTTDDKEEVCLDQLSGFFLLDGTVGYHKPRLGTSQRQTQAWFRQKVRPYTTKALVEGIARYLQVYKDLRVDGKL